MTDAAATFHDVSLFDGRAFPFGECRKAFRFLVRHVIVSVAGIAATGLLIATVFVAAAWMVGAALSTNPNLQAKASMNLRTMALANPDSTWAIAARSAASPRDPANALSFDIQWARAMALTSTPNGIEAIAQDIPIDPLNSEPPTKLALELPRVHAGADIVLPPDVNEIARLSPAAAPIAAPVAPSIATLVAPPIAAPVAATPQHASDRVDSVPLPRPSPARREIALVPTGQQGRARVAAIIPVPAPPVARRAPAQQVHNRAMALPEADGHTAVYDIAAHTVYLPNGDRLEAHSGLGDKLDDPRYVNVKNRGPTPPNAYALVLREPLFHGVQAIRLNPVDETKMFGRDGMLAHTYMLGPNGQSNGCVSFRDYDRFLHAVVSGAVARLVVVPRLGNTPWRTAAARDGADRRYADNDGANGSVR